MFIVENGGEKLGGVEASHSHVERGEKEGEG